MKQFDIKRIGALAKYDWALEKKHWINMLAVAAILQGIRPLVGMCTADLSTGMGVPLSMTIYAQLGSWTSLAVIVLIVMATKTLQWKFTEPRSSVTYLSLPGSNLEKWLLMVAEYAGAVLAVYGIYFLLYYIFTLIGSIAYPTEEWSWNIFHSYDANDLMQLVSVDDVAQDTTRSVMDRVLQNPWVTRVYGWLLYIATIGLYAALNLHFRANSQVKSTLLLLVIYAAVIIGLSIGCFSGIADIASDPTQATDLFMNSLNTFTIICGILIPILALGLLYLTYWQVKNRQAK